MSIIDKIQYNLDNNHDVSAFAIGSLDKKELVIVANHFRNIGYKCEIKMISSDWVETYLLTVYR